MKILALAGILFASVGASANCPNALFKSAEAALTEARDRRLGECRVSSVKQVSTWPSEALESWRVELRCSNLPMRSYAVSLKGCSVTRVQLAPLSGRHCGLSDIWGGETSQPWNFDFSNSLNLKTMSYEGLRQLPEHTRRQLQKIAQTDQADIAKVVGYLKDSSRAAEVYVHQFSFREQGFEAVEFFPGGKTYGLIFKSGTSDVLASNSNGEISCSESLASHSVGSEFNLENGRGCYAPWGRFVPNGASVRAFENRSPPKGDLCRSQYRTCRDGVLSGYFRYDSCHTSY